MNTFKTCKIEGCVKHVVAFDLCCTHYSKFKKYGDPLAGRTNSGGTCSVVGCDKPVKGLSFCQTHYDRFKKHGDPLLVKIMPKDADPTTTVKIENRCKVEGCEGKHKAHGFCAFHAHRNKLHGDPLGGGEKFLPPDPLRVCKIEGCGRKSVARNLCNNHSRKKKKYGDPLGGTTRPYAGCAKDWHENKEGYIRRFDPKNIYTSKSGMILQHRLVISEQIGRKLLRHESVHHKNGNRADNRIENLELWSKSQPAGQRVVDKLKWAREIIDLYGNLDIV